MQSQQTGQAPTATMQYAPQPQFVQYPAPQQQQGGPQQQPTFQQPQFSTMQMLPPGQQYAPQPQVIYVQQQQPMAPASRPKKRSTSATPASRKAGGARRGNVKTATKAKGTRKAAAGTGGARKAKSTSGSVRKVTGRVMKTTTEKDENGNDVQVKWLQEPEHVRKDDVFAYMRKKIDVIHNKGVTAWGLACRRHGAISTEDKYEAIPKVTDPKYAIIKKTKDEILAEWGSGPIPEDCLMIPFGIKAVTDDQGNKSYIPDEEVMRELLELCQLPKYRAQLSKSNAKGKRKVIKTVYNRLKAAINKENQTYEQHLESVKNESERKRKEREEKKKLRAEEKRRFEEEEAAAAGAGAGAHHDGGDSGHNDEADESAASAPVKRKKKARAAAH